MVSVSDSHQRKEFSPTDREKVRLAGALHTCITHVRTSSLLTNNSNGTIPNDLKMVYIWPETGAIAPYLAIFG